MNNNSINTKPETISRTLPTSFLSKQEADPLNLTIQHKIEESFSLLNISSIQSSRFWLSHKVTTEEIKSQLEVIKLKSLFSLQKSVGSPLPDPSFRSHSEMLSINLKPYKLDILSSNPVALVRKECFLPCKLMKSEFDSVSSLRLSEALDNIPKYFNKEGMLNNLRILLNNEFTSLEQKGSLILRIQEFTNNKDVYIDEKTLESVCENLGLPLKSFLKNLDSCVKLNDIKNHQEIFDVAKQVLQKGRVAPPHQPIMASLPAGTIYKGGQENVREILAFQKALIEGYEDILHLKERVITPGLNLKWGSDTLLHLIKSEFLEGYEHISATHWKNLGVARETYDLERFLTHTVSPETLKNLREAEQTILDYHIDPIALCKLAFYEIKINPNDFHIEQFMIGPNHCSKEKKCAISIDEGRWGSPDIAYRYGTSVAVTFKNSLITHPLCFQPVPQEFKSFVEKRLEEIDETVKTLKDKGLVWPIEEFDNRVALYQETIETLSNLHHPGRILDESLPELAEKYAIPLDSHPSPNELRMQLENLLSRKKTDLKTEAFAKQSEQSLIKEIDREKRMARYILASPESTIYGAFEVGYPELATFMNVLRRMEIDPGKSLAYTSAMGMLIPRNLTSFIQHVKTKQIASEEEINQMEQDLATLTTKHLTSPYSIALTSNAC